MDILAKKLSNLTPSATLAVNQKAAELKAEGMDIISLSAGEPDFDTPDIIKQAAIKAINEGKTRYTNVAGIPELQEAVIAKLKKDNGLDYNRNNIIVGTGAKQVLYNLFAATINQGDEVIIPTPYWVSYADMLKLSEGKPVFVNCPIKQNFKITPKQLEQAITPKTKWLVLNSPNNPTGELYSEKELQALAKVLLKHKHVYILSDDIYEHITFDQKKFHNIASIEPSLFMRTFVINGVSKAYAMTGWRIGYGAGDSRIVKAMSMIQSHSTSNPCSISQYAALAALTSKQDLLTNQRKIFEQKRDLVLSILKDCPGIECSKAEGAFYLFPSCKSLFGKKKPDGTKVTNSVEFASYLLEDAQVAVVPGIAFGAEGFFRISYATSFALIEKACHRIKDSCKKLI